MTATLGVLPPAPASPVVLVPPVSEPAPPDPQPPGACQPGACQPGAGVVDVGWWRRLVEQAPRGDAPEVLVLGETDLIDQVRELEAVQHAVAALQADRIRAFARAHAASRAELEGDGLDPRQLERSIAAQIGLACGVSPTRGRTRLRTARDLHAGLDHVRGLHAGGELSAEKAAAIVGAGADLDPDERARLDHELADHDLPTLGVGRLRDLARRLVATINPEKFAARATRAAADRRVTLRPGQDGMCWLTAHLPVEQGAAALAALTAAVRNLWSDATAVVTRSRGQTMVDTLVERLTGQATAEHVDVQIQAIVPVEALLDPDNVLPATIPGLGPVPLQRLLTHRAGRLSLRRLLTRDGTIVGGDSRQRSFTGVLAELIRARDGHRCREPYCDAPVRHLDHIERHEDGGQTTVDNARGVCEFHNYLREQPGWTVRTTPDGIATTTPTGHTHTSPTPRAA